MKSDTSKARIEAVRTALAEVERISEAVRAAVEAPWKAYRARERELAELKVVHESEVIDPYAPDGAAKIEARSRRAAKIEALETLAASMRPENQPRPKCPEDGKLYPAVQRLQKLLWEIAEPAELCWQALQRCGLILCAADRLTPDTITRRLLNYAKNFDDGACIIARLAKEILSRRVQPLPAHFGMAPRALTFAEQTTLEQCLAV